MTKFFNLLLIVGAAAFFILANVLSLRWARSHGTFTFLLLAVVGLIGFLLFGILSNRHHSVAVGSGLCDSMCIIGTILVGTLILGEAFSLRQVVGLGFAVAAVILMI